MYPTISIVTPAYNAEKIIQDLYSNLINVLSEDIEWIIVNDCSTDETKNIINLLQNKSKFIHVYHLEHNKGPQFARFHGAQKSNGNIIYLLDVDDLIYTNNFLRFIEFIKSDNRYDYYFSLIYSINDRSFFSSNPVFPNNKIKEKPIEIKKPTDFIKYSFPHPSSLAINREFFLKVYKHSDLSWGEDIYIYLLLSQSGIGCRWIRPISCYINTLDGRGSKLSLSLRMKLILKLLTESFSKKIINSLLFSFYMSIRYITSYIYKKLR